MKFTVESVAHDIIAPYLNSKHNGVPGMESGQERATLEAIAARLNEMMAQQAASVPEGYALVPIQPTTGMLEAVRDWALKKYGQGIGNDGAIGCWNTMLAAAPQPPEQAGADARDAARYRWLRENHSRPNKPASVVLWADEPCEPESAEELDNAIDAAMAGGGK